MSFQRMINISGWITFLIALIVYYMSVESTGSLWDCGEFISGAYKLQVVHPPGAPLFLMVGRIFAWVASIFSKNPENIAVAVNIMSAICSAFAAMFVCWTTIYLGKLIVSGRDQLPEGGDAIVIAGAGIIAGLATAFSTSIWFSAVEGEVYAMSTFFTALTVWAMVKWYYLPDTPESDKWIVLAVYATGLSIGVHLLSLLTFPAMALFYYFKKYKEHTLKGMFLSFVGGAAFIIFVQNFIIVGLPWLWSKCELMLVNGFGLPPNTGIIPSALIAGGLFWLAMRYAQKNQNAVLQKFLVSVGLLCISFTMFGMVVIRAIANPPINMNAPSNAMRMIPYLNREQYGERSMLRGPYYDARPVDSKTEDRYGLVGDKYEITDQKVEYVFADEDKMVFPRMGDYNEPRPQLYKMWLGREEGKPSQAENLGFMWRYQLGWMYWRYFMWNFAGRQNGEQGYYPWDKSKGHWISGIPFVDNIHLGFDQSNITERAKSDPARNEYYLLPLIFGLIGLFYHYQKNRKDWLATLALFLLTGVGIIIYTNQPPNEPRERDYVLVGSFFTFCIWIGIGAIAIYHFLKTKVKLGGVAGGAIATLLVLSAPLIMGFQNFDDHSRRGHYASRDYAANFLNSVEKNAILFTYGDNDTYPLWYAQEVEGIRRDVRVINLSLIAVDWYINQMPRKVNDADLIKLTIPESGYRGNKRIQLPVEENGPSMSLKEAIKYAGEDHPVPIGNGRQFESVMPSKNLYIPVDKQAVLKSGLVSARDSNLILDRLDFQLSGNSVIKDDLAVMDVIASNVWERPIYFAVTCQSDKMVGLDDYMQLEGLALRLVPFKTPSDKKYGIIGSGRVNTEKCVTNMTTKWKWGTLDKEKKYVSTFYQPSYQSMRFTMLRAAQDALMKGDSAASIKIMETQFQAFPNMNYIWDYNLMPMISTYLQAGGQKYVNEVIRTTANNIVGELKFMMNLPPDVLQKGWEEDFARNMRVKDDLITATKSTGHADLAAELEKLFAPYKTPPLRN